MRRPNSRAAVHARLAALESKAEAKHVVPVVVAHVDGHVDGCGDQRWPSLDAMRADLAGKQSRMPLIIQLAVDPPEAPEESNPCPN